MSSDYAALGSAAHQLAEMALLDGKPASAYLGQSITVEEGKHSLLGASGAHRWLKCPASPGLQAGRTKTVHPPKSFTIDIEMVDSVQVYLDAVRQVMRDTGGVLCVEKAFCLDWIDADLWGTADAVVAEPFGGLYVFDYKHGEGEPVEVENNPQFKFYACGALGSEGGGYEFVESIVVQPRADHVVGPVRSCRYSPDELLRWASERLATGVARCKGPSPDFVDGPHCKGCDPDTYAPAATCPRMRQLAGEVACLPTDITEVPQKPILPLPMELTPEQMSKALEASTMLTGWFKAIKEYALNELKAGREVAGYKLVSGRANRSWSDDQAVAHFVSQLDGVSAWTEPKLRSPKQVEDEIKAVFKGRDKQVTKQRKELLAALSKFVNVSKGVTMAPASDKRPAINSSATDAFGALE